MKQKEGKFKQKVMKKSELNKFISGLMGKYEVIAPVKEDIVRWKAINKPEEIYLKEISLVPFKKFFIPENDELFEFNGNKTKSNEKIGKRVIFGARKCDLNSLQVLDKVMHDAYYLERRKNTILIGFFCENPDLYCFCDSMKLENYYDLFFYPNGDDYHISIGSRNGLKLVKNFGNAKKRVEKEPINIKELPDKDIEKNYRNSIWQSDVDKCLSCSACTVYCPTCNCFDIEDKLNIDLKSGSRKRGSASCQLKSFSRVAGGKVFRESRNSRFKHFVYHKIVYYRKRFGRYMCVGCGRCLRVCPTKIDWVETINLLRDEEKNV